MKVVRRQPINQYCTHETEYNYTMQCNQNIIKTCVLVVCVPFSIVPPQKSGSRFAHFGTLSFAIFSTTLVIVVTHSIYNRMKISNTLVQIKVLTAIHSWSNRQFLCAVRILMQSRDRLYKIRLAG